MIAIDNEKCNGCGFCRDVCPDYAFKLKPAAAGLKAIVRYPDQCCSCGHCIAVCPTGALSHTGLTRSEFKKIQDPGINAESLKALMISRRSTRKYKQSAVPASTVDDLLEAAQHSGSGSNLQSVEFAVITDREILNKIEQETINILWKSGLKLFTGKRPLHAVFNKIFGKQLTHQFQKYHNIIKNRRMNNLLIAHDQKKNSMGPYNCAIALRNIELLAHAMKLGTCWAGLFLTATWKKPRLIDTYLDLGGERMICGALMLGYPHHRYLAEIPREKKVPKIIKSQTKEVPC
jgi:nitroreductase/NAD-dependent dihydropyrimidine dehydrogenase PreA subunit